MPCRGSKESLTFLICIVIHRRLTAAHRNSENASPPPTAWENIFRRISARKTRSNREDIKKPAKHFLLYGHRINIH